MIRFTNLISKCTLGLCFFMVRLYIEMGIFQGEKKNHDQTVFCTHCTVYFILFLKSAFLFLVDINAQCEK